MVENHYELKYTVKLLPHI